MAATGVAAVHAGMALAASRDSSRPACETHLLPSESWHAQHPSCCRAQDHWVTAQAQLTCRPRETPHSCHLQGTPHQLGVAFNKQPASLWRQHNSRLHTAQLSSVHEAALGAVLTQQLCPLLQVAHLSWSLGQQQAAILLQDGLKRSGLALWQCWQL